MSESKILLLMCVALCTSFLGLLVFVEVEQWSQYKEYDDNPVIELPPSPPVKEPKIKIPYDTVSLIASAVSAITESSVLTYYDYLERDQADMRVYEQLDFTALYKSRLIGGPVAHVKSNSSSTQSSSFGIIVRTLTNQELLIEDLSSRDTVHELKRKIQSVQGAAPRLQRLVFNGRKLSNDDYLGSYNIDANSIVRLEIQSKDDFETVKFINPEFTNFEKHVYFSKEKYHKDDLTAMRGGVKKELCGWRRIGLISSYTQNNLNVTDWSEEREVEIRDGKKKRKWEISYHGTEKHHHHSIADDGYLASRKHRFNFCQGIYTTPDINVASSHAKMFTHNGAKFEILFQNLVNSETLVKIQTHKIHNNRYWVSPRESNVKPYGILIRRVDIC